MRSRRPTVSISETDIVSERVLSRRSLMSRLGLGLGAGAVVMAGGAAPAAAFSDPEEHGRRCPYRHFDASDPHRINCGSTDTD